VAQAEEARELAFELGGVAPGRQPEVEAGVDEESNLRVVEDLAGDRHGRLAGDELGRGERRRVVAAHHLQDLRAQLVGTLRHRTCRITPKSSSRKGAKKRRQALEG
jgi:hypothetical protein